MGHEEADDPHGQTDSHGENDQRADYGEKVEAMEGNISGRIH